MFQVLVSPERHVQVPHTCRIVLVRHLVDHVRREHAVRALRGVAPFRGDTSLETLGQVVQDWNQPVVLVKPWKCLGRCLYDRSDTLPL